MKSNKNFLLLEDFILLTDEDQAEAFDGLNINDRVKYYNYCRADGESWGKLEKRLHKQWTTIKQKFKNEGYILTKDKKEFIKVVAEDSKQQIFMTDKMVLDRLEEVEGKMEKLQSLVASVPTINPIEINEHKCVGLLVTRSFRVYQSILNDFSTFCDNNKNHSKQDLYSQALYEFMENHK